MAGKQPHAGDLLKACGCLLRKRRDKKRRCGMHTANERVLILLVSIAHKMRLLINRTLLLLLLLHLSIESSEVSASMLR